MLTLIINQLLCIALGLVDLQKVKTYLLSFWLVSFALDTYELFSSIDNIIKSVTAIIEADDRSTTTARGRGRAPAQHSSSRTQQRFFSSSPTRPRSSHKTRNRSASPRFTPQPFSDANVFDGVRIEEITDEQAEEILTCSGRSSPTLSSSSSSGFSLSLVRFDSSSSLSSGLTSPSSSCASLSDISSSDELTKSCTQLVEKTAIVQEKEGQLVEILESTPVVGLELVALAGFLLLSNAVGVIMYGSYVGEVKTFVGIEDEEVLVAEKGKVEEEPVSIALQEASAGLILSTALAIDTIIIKTIGRPRANSLPSSISATVAEEELDLSAGVVPSDSFCILNIRPTVTVRRTRAYTLPSVLVDNSIDGADDEECELASLPVVEKVTSDAPSSSPTITTYITGRPRSNSLPSHPNAVAHKDIARKSNSSSCLSIAPDSVASPAHRLTYLDLATVLFTSLASFTSRPIVGDHLDTSLPLPPFPSPTSLTTGDFDAHLPFSAYSFTLDLLNVARHSEGSVLSSSKHLTAIPSAQNDSLPPSSLTHPLHFPSVLLPTIINTYGCDPLAPFRDDEDEEGSNIASWASRRGGGPWLRRRAMPFYPPGTPFSVMERNLVPGTLDFSRVLNKRPEESVHGFRLYFSDEGVRPVEVYWKKPVA